MPSPEFRPIPPDILKAAVRPVIAPQSPEEVYYHREVDPEKAEEAKAMFEGQVDFFKQEARRELSDVSKKLASGALSKAQAIVEADGIIERNTGFHEEYEGEYFRIRMSNMRANLMATFRDAIRDLTAQLKRQEEASRFGRPVATPLSRDVGESIAHYWEARAGIQLHSTVSLFRAGQGSSTEAHARCAQIWPVVDPLIRLEAKRDFRLDNPTEWDRMTESDQNEKLRIAAAQRRIGILGQVATARLFEEVHAGNDEEKRDYILTPTENDDAIGACDLMVHHETEDGFDVLLLSIKTLGGVEEEETQVPPFFRGYSESEFRENGESQKEYSERLRILDLRKRLEAEIEQKRSVGDVSRDAVVRVRPIRVNLRNASRSLDNVTGRIRDTSMGRQATVEGESLREEFRQEYDRFIDK